MKAGRTPSAVGALLAHWSVREWRHQPWRTAAALVAVMLGVALAFSVHLINESALGEFSAAVRQANAQPDFELRAQRGGFDESLFERVALHPQVAAASPVVELDTYALSATGERVALKVLGVDALRVASLAPALLPRAREGAPRLALLDPDAVFLNATAERRLAVAPGQALRLQAGTAFEPARLEGRVMVDGPATAVMDIAGAQARFGQLGRLSRINVRLVPGADRQDVLRAFGLPEGVRAAGVDEAQQRVSNLSRAYRVNLTVLALVALFTGSFLVFSILALSVSQRTPQLALLGVLGLSARERLRLVLAESALLGVAGSALGLALGTALAWLALRLLSGDLGGAYFPGVQPTLQWSTGAALAYGGLGVAAALVGGWVPARQAGTLAPAQALKGLGADADADRASRPLWRRALAPALLLMGAALAMLPPVFGLPLAAYASVALLLVGGIAGVPALVGLLLLRLRPTRQPLALLAVERARHQRDTATIAVAGVVASLSLAVALTVMVSSFRGSILEWLDTVLPADLYARTATASAASDSAYLDPRLVEQVQALPGVQRLEAVRVASVVMDPLRPAVALIARPLADAARELPLVGELDGPPAPQALPTAPGAKPPEPALPLTVYVSEAMVNLYGARAGTRFELPLPDGRRVAVRVRGVWRDYARQHGAVVLRHSDFIALTGDRRVNDLALWLDDGAEPGPVQASIRSLARPGGAAPDDPVPIEFATPGEIRQLSLRIFDRSFAVTYWLQAVAIAIGLFGIAASFSAQVMARRKEFGLLSHLGLTRRQILTVVAAEGAVWTAAGTLLGLALGLVVSAVLVHVVNPQSFNWTMQLQVPAQRLALLCAAVVLCGTVTAWWAGRAAARRDLALSVKEDW